MCCIRPASMTSPTIKTVVSALKKPFNLVMGFADPTLTVPLLSAAGVKRIALAVRCRAWRLRRFCVVRAK